MAVARLRDYAEDDGQVRSEEGDVGQGRGWGCVKKGRLPMSCPEAGWGAGCG